MPIGLPQMGHGFVVAQGVEVPESGSTFCPFGSSLPHFVQASWYSCPSAPQEGHFTDIENDGSSFPHPMQKVAPEGFDFPQFGQYMLIPSGY